MILTKEDAKRFLLSYAEFTHNDFVEGAFWFRDDGPMDKFKRHEYTINHETEGVIGVTREEAVSYVYRNRRRLNHADPVMIQAVEYDMNPDEKDRLMKEAKCRSRAMPDEVHYVLQAGCFGMIVTDAEKARKYMDQGYRLYWKMLNGELVRGEGEER